MKHYTITFKNSKFYYTDSCFLWNSISFNLVFKEI